MESNRRTMSAHERRPDERLDAYLCRVILAIARTHNGEFRIKSSEVDIDTRQLLVRDFDPATNEIVFRAESRYAEPIWVEPVQSAWTIPFADRARELGIDTPGGARHRIPTDDELASGEQLQRARAEAVRTNPRNTPPRRTQPPITTEPQAG
jgi:hypothetical protein